MVGSTSLRVRLGEEQADELRRIHDDLLTACVEANGTSYNVVAKVPPLDVLPMTWMVALPVNVATPAVILSDPGVTRPLTSIC